MEQSEFRAQILRLNDSRSHKVSGSLGVYDAYKWIRKNKWLNIGSPISEHDFYSIIRGINNCLANELIKGTDINLPHRLGRLEVRKNVARYTMKDDKVKTNLPVDWDATLKLWYEDQEAYDDKTLVKQEEKEIFKVVYNKSKAEYTNKSFYQFDLNRDIKRRLKQQIREGKLDAFML